MLQNATPAELHQGQELKPQEPQPQHQLAAPASGEDEPADDTYYIHDGCFYRLHVTKNNVRGVKLSNFTARITHELISDDGSGEVMRRFRIAGQLDTGEPLPLIEIPAAEFFHTNWPVKYWGARAMCLVSSRDIDHLRCAIQSHSDAQELTVFTFTHTGWRKIGDKWVYLTAGGGIGADGLVTNVQVSLPEGLKQYNLPEPPTGQELVDAVSDSLSLLDVAPLTVTAPILAAIYRAPLLYNGEGYCLLLVGARANSLQRLAMLALNHFGQFSYAPVSWRDNINDIRAAASVARGVLLFIDNWLAGVSKCSKERYAVGKACGFMRHMANCSYVGEWPSSGLTTLRPLVLAIADGPIGSAGTRARLFTVEIPEEIGQRIALFQKRVAKQAVLAKALSAYVQWLAKWYDANLSGEDNDPALRELKDKRFSLFEEAQGALGPQAHARALWIVADLGLALKHFMIFATEIGSLLPKQAEELWQQLWSALLERGRKQCEYIQLTT